MTKMRAVADETRPAETVAPATGERDGRAARTPFARWGAALRYPAFRLLWLSLLPGTLGMMMAMVAFGYVAYQLSGSTTTLAVVNLGWGVPLFLLSPVAGVVADRFARRNVLLATQAVVGLSAVAAAALILTGSIQVWHLVAVTTAQGMAFAFNMPARQALIAELVDRADLANALAIYNAGLNLNRVAGPAIGGALLTLPAVGAGGVFTTTAALYAVVLLALWRIPATAARPAARPRARASVVSQLSAGLRYVLGQPALRRLLVLASLPLLFGMPYQSLMPAVAARVFQVDAAGLGALLSANGLGALGGSLLVAGLSSAGDDRRLSHLQLGAGLLFSASLLGFAVSGAFVAALPLIALTGGAAAAYTAVNNTLLMSQTPPEYHGRVMGVYMMTFSAMPLSSLPAAWVADQIGLPSTLAVCAALSGLVVLTAGGASGWFAGRA
ncbi:MAG: MFS transporter, partial [Chloroflexota bacterium]